MLLLLNCKYSLSSLRIVPGRELLQSKIDEALAFWEKVGASSAHVSSSQPCEPNPLTIAGVGGERGASLNRPQHPFVLREFFFEKRSTCLTLPAASPPPSS